MASSRQRVSGLLASPQPSGGLLAGAAPQQTGGLLGSPTPELQEILDRARLIREQIERQQFPQRTQGDQDRQSPGSVQGANAQGLNAQDTLDQFNQFNDIRQQFADDSATTFPGGFSVGTTGPAESAQFLGSDGLFGSDLTLGGGAGSGFASGGPLAGFQGELGATSSFGSLGGGAGAAGGNASGAFLGEFGGLSGLAGGGGASGVGAAGGGVAGLAALVFAKVIDNILKPSKRSGRTNPFRSVFGLGTGDGEGPPESAEARAAREQQKALNLLNFRSDE